LSRLISNKPQKLKIQKSIAPSYPNNPSFSFCYLTTNKKYNFESLDKGKQKEWSAALVDRMIEISKEDWIYWFGLPKNKGIETIPYEKVNFSPNEIGISDDEKVIVFRFNSQKGRIIGFKVDTIFYIIGFDFDFSAYDHG